MGKYYHEEDGGEALKYDASWDGVVPAENRRMTDKVCGFIFFAFLAAQLTITIVAGSKSDLRLIGEGSEDSGSGDWSGFTRDLHGLSQYRGVLGIGAGATLLLALIWMEFLKRFTKCVVYTSLAGAVAFTTAAGVVLLTTSADHNSTALRISGVVVLVFALIMVIAIFFFRKKINFSCAIIGHACRAIQGNLSLFTVITPILVILTVGTLAWWGVTCVYVASMAGSEVQCGAFTTHTKCRIHGCDFTGEAGKEVCTGVGHNLNTAARWSYLFLVFSLFWGQMFLSGVAKVTVAGTISSWYFTRNKSDVPIGNSVRVLGWCFRFHWGTIALASFILAAFRFVKWILDQASRETDNCCVKVVLCLIRCVVSCVEALFKFVTKYAYIYVSMHGSDFVQSCKNVNNLFHRSSFGTIFLNDMVTHLIVRFGTIAATALVVFGSVMYMKHDGHGDISITCIVLLTVFCIFTFLLVGNVVEIAADAVIVCFMEDSERNGASRDFRGEEIHTAISDSAQVFVHHHPTPTHTHTHTTGPQSDQRRQARQWKARCVRRGVKFGSIWHLVLDSLCPPPFHRPSSPPPPFPRGPLKPTQSLVARYPPLASLKKKRVRPATCP